MKTLGNSLLFPLLFSILSSLATTVSASSRLPGVVTEQMLYYVRDSGNVGNDTQSTAMLGEDHFWYNITVKEVSQQNITYAQETNDSNLPSNSANSTIEIDVQTGSVNVSVNWYAFFVACNLSAGDTTFDSANYQDQKINETVVRDYLGSSMQTCHWLVQYPEQDVYYGGIQFKTKVTTDAYWDRKTGILLEMVEQGYDYRPSPSNIQDDLLTVTRTSRTLLQSAKPSVPEFPGFLLVFMCMTAALLIPLFYRRKRFRMLA
jgi:hypothetical protein